MAIIGGDLSVVGVAREEETGTKAAVARAKDLWLVQHNS